MRTAGRYPGDGTPWHGHVRITPHCGPLAALEGVTGGPIADGGTRLCDQPPGSAE